MSMTVEIYSDDELTGDRFYFYTNESGMFWLAEYARLTRPSKRHKFRTEIKYDASRSRLYGNDKPTTDTCPTLAHAIHRAEVRLRERIRYVDGPYGDKS